jgi:3-hydroxybutyryl-CoA dehydratase
MTQKEGYFEDIEVGDTTSTKGRTVTEADIVNFAALTWDTYPLHTDEDWAKANAPFGGRIAHGALTFSYGLGLLMSTTGTGTKVLAFYGVEKLRFTAPTKIGDTIRVESKVLEKEDKGTRGGVVTNSFKVLNQRGETLIDAVTKTLIAKRSPKE